MFSRSSFCATSFYPPSWALTRQREQAPTPPSVIGGAGRARRRYSDNDLRALVDAKWEAIEAGQLADAAAQAARSATAAAIQVAQAPVIDIGRPAVAADVAAAPALLPGAAQRARDARRRDDEDALILLLLET